MTRNIVYISHYKNKDSYVLYDLFMCFIYDIAYISNLLTEIAYNYKIL